MINGISDGIAKLMLIIEKELIKITKESDTKVDKLIDIIMNIYGRLNCEQYISTEMSTIFLEGAGISKRRAKDFGTRLGQLGFLVGDPEDKRITNNDLVIFISASATTDTTVSSFNRIRKGVPKAILVLITANPETNMARLCNLVIQLPGRENTKEEDSPLSLLGANFESAIDKLKDIVVHRLRLEIAELEGVPVEQSSVSEHAMRERHALI